MTPKRDTKEEMRTEISRHVHRRLADRDFADRLVANEATGERPILVALREDSMSRVLTQSAKLGGTVNLFVGIAAGIVGVGLEGLTAEVANRRARDAGGSVIDIRRDCTVGVFLAQLEILRDEPSILRFVDGTPNHNANGSARVVAFA